MDLKKITKIPQRHKEIVNGYIRQAQSIMPRDNAYYNIVDLIKQKILLFYYYSFESNLLNDEQKDKLLKLLDDSNKEIANWPWSREYESAKHGFTTSAFAEKIHNKQNIVLLIKLNDDIIIGGYTKTGWDESKVVENSWIADKDAFVFYLESPEKYESFISNVKQDEDSISKALGYNTHYYGMFGATWVFAFAKDFFAVQEQSDTYGVNYEAFKHEQPLLSGSEQEYYNLGEYAMEAFVVEIVE